MSKTKEIKVTLSDQSELTSHGNRYSLSKYASLNDILFWIHKYNSPSSFPCPEHSSHIGTIYTVNAKIEEVFYTVRLDSLSNPICRHAEKKAEKKVFACDRYWDVSQAVEFQADPEMFVEVVKSSNMFDFDHPEILEILGANHSPIMSEESS